MISVILFGCALALWGIVAAGVPLGHGRAVVSAAGAACLVLGGVRWMLASLLRDPFLRDRVVRRLADALIGDRRRALRQTRPLRVVH